MANIKINHREKIAETKFPLEQITFQKPDLNGQLHDQRNEIYFRPDAVTVLMIDPKAQKLLFTRQFRLATYLNGNADGYLLETCAGLIDEGETPEQAVHREADEETGYALTELKKVGGVYTSGGGITEFVHLFTGFYNSKGEHNQGGGKPEEGEDIELIELSYAEAHAMLCDGVIKDAKTLLLLQYFELNPPA